MRIQTMPPINLLERPRCSRCGIRMTLAARQAGHDGSEKRSFECVKCNFIATKIADDPLKSDAVIHLFHSLRPPR
jgi:tRNA(Ile2) C34 agmatinyltransferase TiaS